MKTFKHIHKFIDPFVTWAAAQTDIQAIALVGSYARGVARDDSDIDLVLFTEQPAKYLTDITWVEGFGQIEKHQSEDYGKVTSLRIWYLDGPEVEFGITTPDWAVMPLDAGTKQVIEDGMVVLFERSALLSPHIIDKS